jgi:putative ATPase
MPLTGWALPEGRYHLAEAALYLATAPKSNSILAFFDALHTVEKEGKVNVPSHLKDASRDKQGFGHGEGYLYPHAYRDHWTAQQYLPDALQGKMFYNPSHQGYEKAFSFDRQSTPGSPTGRHGRRGCCGTRGGAHFFSRRPGSGPMASAVHQPGGTTTGRVRDRILAAAEIKRHGIVLDLNAGTGLLTWEAVRRTPEGSVWALAGDEASASRAACAGDEPE